MSLRLATLVAALASCATVGCASNSHLDIERAELQARIEPRFPTHHCRIVIACLDLSNPVVVLTEGEDRIGLKLDAKVQAGTRQRSGRVGFSGKPRYLPAEGQLFLDDLQITTLEFEGLPAEYAEIVKWRGPQVIQSRLQSHPVYTIDTRTAKGTLAKLVVQDVKVVNGRLRISFVR